MQYQIEQLPPYLILSLSRFYYCKTSKSKKKRIDPVRLCFDLELEVDEIRKKEDIKLEQEEDVEMGEAAKE